MKRRKLRSAITLARATLAVHDRRATDLPTNAVIATQTTADPYDGAAIQVAVSIRDDPLGRLHARRQIDDAQFNGGRRWQLCFEHTQLWPSAELKDPVDGGGHLADPYVRIADASAVLRKCRDRLGEQGDGLIRDVLGSRLFLAQVAASRGLNPDSNGRDMAYLGRRLQECLNTLARVFGYA
jgi:hypothetical protein